MAQLPTDPVELHSVPDQCPPISLRYAQYLRERALIPSWRVGKRVFFDRSDLERLVAAGYRPQAQPNGMTRDT